MATHIVSLYMSILSLHLTLSFSPVWRDARRIGGRSFLLISAIPQVHEGFYNSYKAAKSDVNEVC